MLMRVNTILKLIQKGYDTMFMEHDTVSGCNGYGNDEKKKCSMGSSRQSMEQTECGGHSAWGLKNYPLAMMYVPLQSFEKLYDVEKALEFGTVFEDLNLPFEGKSVYNSGKGGCCHG